MKSPMRKVFAIVLALLMTVNYTADVFAGTGGAGNEPPASCTHYSPENYTRTFQLTDDALDCSCVPSIGCGEIVYCSNCGEFLHVGKWTGALPTGVEINLKEGTISVTCSTCSATTGTLSLETGLPVVPCDHEWTTDTTATCTEDGIKTFTCVHCGQHYDEPDEAKGHSFEPTGTTPGSCTEKGVVHYECTVCHETKDEDIDAPGHTYKPLRQVPATCTAYGYTVYKCDVCGDEKTDDYVPFASHSYDEGVYEDGFDCELGGNKIYTCSVCGDVHTDVIPAGSHDYVTTELIPATCTETGTVNMVCSVCGDEYSQILPIDSEAHDWFLDSHVDSDCKTNGCDHMVCSRCSAANDIILPLSEEHNWQPLPGTNTATCTEAGTETHVCDVCGGSKEVPTAALGHLWDEWQVISEPTCTQPGEHYHDCLRSGCSERETEEMPALGHNYVNYVCTRCGNTYPEVQAILDAIDSLITADQVTDENAESTYFIVTGIRNQITEVNKTATLKNALNALKGSRLSKLDATEQACLRFLRNTTYVPGYTQRAGTFRVFWNDNYNTTDRVSPAEFLTKAAPVIHYEVRAKEDGSFVSGGSFSTPAQANSELSFLGINIPSGTQLLTYSETEGIGTILTDEALPDSYTAVYNNPAAGTRTSTEYLIRYSVELKSPDSRKYIITDPEPVNGSAMVASGSRMILTRTVEWQAGFNWNDDGNRSPLGGASTEDCPRPEMSVVMDAMTVYLDGENGSTELEEGFELVFEKKSDDRYEITLKGLPAYDNSGLPLSYYIRQDSIDAANKGKIPGNKYAVSYYNLTTVKAKHYGAYNGGTIYNTLSNTMTLTVNKVWVDRYFNDETARPDASYSIWRVSENYDANDNLDLDMVYAFGIPDCEMYYSVPKYNTSSQFYTVDDNGAIQSYSFPMYDGQGRRYIYFGKEIGALSGYSRENDVSNADASPVVRELFADQYPQYFITGGTVTNRLSNHITLPLSLELKATSLQGKFISDDSVQATFILQKQAEDGTWVNANVTEDRITYSAADVEDGTVIIGPNGEVSVVLSHFFADKSKESYEGIGAEAYSYEDFSTKNYRWLEKKISINGIYGEFKDNSWTQTGSSLVYGSRVYAGNGQTADETSGPNGTTAAFTAAASGSDFVNTLVGELQLEVKKYFFDENGNNISGDLGRIGSSRVTFSVLQNGAASEEVIITSDDMVGPGNNYWLKIITLNRYDEEGREYEYDITEAHEAGYTNRWLEDNSFETVSVEYPAGSGIYVKRLKSSYVNAIGGGGPGAFKFEIKKEWLDDSDLLNRYPVEVALVRFRLHDGTLLDEPEIMKDGMIITAEDNWLLKSSVLIPAGETAADFANNYLMIEKGMYIDGKLIMSQEYEDLMSDSQLLADLRAGMSGNDVLVGTVNNNTPDARRMLSKYMMYENVGAPDSTGRTPFILTNLRVGYKDFVIDQIWKTGGTVYKTGLGFYEGEKLLLSFDLEVDESEGSPKAVISNVKWEDGVEFDTSEILLLPGAESVVLDENGNYRLNVNINNLPKYDALGCYRHFDVKQLYVINGDTTVNITDDRYTIGDYNYGVAYESEVEYSFYETGRVGGTETVTITNSRLGSYPIVSNKIWRDENDGKRPDISFCVYRVSTVIPGVRALVEAGDAQALSAYLAENYRDADHRIITDRYWNTKRNKYWWTCSIDALPQYDSAGYPYIYFADERLGASALWGYEGYYYNGTYADGYRPLGITGFQEDEPETKQVFAIPTDDLESANSGVFILADGVHRAENGSFTDYYSASAINLRVGDEEVKGEKIWMLPTDWAIPLESLPQVSIMLYRSLNEYKPSEFANTSEYVSAVVADSELILTQKLNESGDGVYTFDIKEDTEGERLPSYDLWGSEYYYYVLESEEGSENRPNFPMDEVVYEDDSFNMSNMFVSKGPYAEITVKKIWDIDEDLRLHLAENGLEGLTPADLADAEIKLTGKPLDKDGNIIDGALIEIASVVLSTDGKAVVSYNGTDVKETLSLEPVVDADSVTLSFTFDKFWNTETEQFEQIPYEWLKNYGIEYSLDETKVNGYKVTCTNQTVVFNAVPEKINQIDVYKNTDSATTVENTYQGFNDEKISVEFAKLWNDKYVDNDDYRPDEIEYTIDRYVNTSAGREYDTFTALLTLKKQGFEGTETWKAELENLLRYDPQGRDYYYHVSKEALGTEVVEVAGDGNKNIGQYTLTGSSDTILINTLRDDLRVQVTANKQWTFNGKAITSYNTGADSFDALRKLGILPQTVSFIIMRSVNGVDWEYAPASAYDDPGHIVNLSGTDVLGRKIDFAGINENNFADTLNASMTWENLPKYVSHTDIQYCYRVVEQITWYDGETTTVLDNGDNRGITTAITANDDQTEYSILNAITALKVRISKTWDDNHNFDNTRPTKHKVKIQIANAGESSAQGKEFSMASSGHSVTAENSNIYYSEFFYLPVYLDLTFDAEGTKNYKLTESYTLTGGAVYQQTITSDGGNVISEQDSEGNTIYTLNITNSYEPTRKTENLKAVKSWSGDSAWSSVTRPSISFKLQYLDRKTNTWKDIENMADFSKDGTQSPVQVVPAAGASANSVTWNQMYKYWKDNQTDGVAQLIKYRVAESVNTANQDSSYTLTTNQFSTAESTTTASVTLSNTLKTTAVDITNAWTKNGEAALTDSEITALITKNAVPKSIDYAIEYFDGETWKKVPGAGAAFTLNTKDLLGGKTASVKAALPRVDKDGKPISYRVVETGMKFSDETEFSFDYTGDKGRSGNISTEITGFTWDGSTVPKVTMPNDFACGEFNLTKLWVDGNNRDNGRADVKIQLYRDGKAYEIKTLTKAVQWTGTVENLPLYQNGSDIKSEYTIAEVGETDGAYVSNGCDYTVEYSDYEKTLTKGGRITASVTNTHELKTITVAGKTLWDDNGDIYGMRPTTSKIKLQYSLKKSGGEWLDVTQVSAIPDPEDDNGTGVFTTSAPTQSLTSADALDDSAWGSAEWAGLPAYVLVDGVSTKVYYRTVETAELPEAYSTKPGKAVCIDNANSEGKAESNVQNNLSLVTKLEGSIQWIDNGTGLLNDYMPDSVTVVLQYRKPAAEKWTDTPEEAAITVTAADNWEFIFDDLPVGYEYRCYEAFMTVGEKDIAATKFKNKADGIVTASMGSFDVRLESEHKIPEEEPPILLMLMSAVHTDDYYITTAYNTLKANIPFTGDTGIQTLYLYVCIASLTALILIIVLRRRRANR